MPGIAGLVSGAPAEECQETVASMVSAMQHDPSYVTTHCFSPKLGVYAACVAHANSFAAEQSERGDPSGATLLCSGEFMTDDGGPLTADALNVLDVARLRELNGLFSGVLIDASRDRSFLFNDRYGSERLYYFDSGQAIYFASEAKAILSVVPECRVVDELGVAQYLIYGNTLSEQTLFRGIRLMPGGSVWSFSAKRCASRQRYFAPREWERQSQLSEDAFERAFAKTFEAQLPAYVRSTSRLGISITGGLDTRMIMACLPRMSVLPICYTYGGLTGETLDARIGAEVAHQCGLEHHHLRIGADFLRDFGNYADRTVFVTDGCAGALGAHEIYLSALARQLAPVRLTGNFGGEVFRSVSTFKPVRPGGGLIAPEFEEMLDHVQAPEAATHPVTHAAFQEVPWHLFGTLAAGRSQVTFRTPYLDNELVQLAFRAPIGARHSSRAATRLIAENSPPLAAMPTDRGLVDGGHGLRYALRRLYCEGTFKLDYWHKEGIPDWLAPLESLLGKLSRFGLLGLHKYLPYRLWFRKELAGYVGDVFSDARTRGLPYWNASALNSIFADHVSGRRNYIREIDAVLTLEAVHRIMLAPQDRARSLA